jgi:hypothetical protein
MFLLVPFSVSVSSFNPGEEERSCGSCGKRVLGVFQASGGRVLGVHGSGSFHRRCESFDTIGNELGHLVESAMFLLRRERLAETCASARWTVSDIQWAVALRAPVQG